MVTAIEIRRISATSWKVIPDAVEANFIQDPYYRGNAIGDNITIKATNGAVYFKDINYQFVSYSDELDSGNDVASFSDASEVIEFLKDVGFFAVSSGGGSGSSTILGLSDVSIGTFIGKALQVLRINAAATAVESFFMNIVQAFTDLVDTPSAIEPLKYLRGNAGGTALEFTDGFTVNQNNIGRRVKLSGFFSDEPTLSEIVSAMNGMTTVITEVQAPIIIYAIKLSITNSKIYPYLFLPGKGTYGVGGTPVNGNMLFALPVNYLTPEDVESDPNARIENLDPVTDGDYITKANTLFWDFSDSGSAGTDGGTISYYFTYTDDGVLYYALFTGTPGEYGAGATPFVEADFVDSTNSEVPPIIPIDPEDFLKLTGRVSQDVEGVVNFENATVINDPVNANDVAIKSYVDGLVTGIIRLAGNWDASGGTYPTTGTGAGGSVRRGDSYIVNVEGTINGQLYGVGDSFYSLVNAPGQTPSNWARFEVPTGMATSVVAGIMKLYTSTGSSTDGTMDRNSITTAINAKVADVITDGVTSVAPSQNAVFDALLTKMTLRGNVGSSINLDTLIVPGYYHTGLTTTNTPPGLSISVSLLIVMKSLATTGTTIIQHFYESGTSRHAVRSSADTGTTWSAWAISQEELVSGTNIKTVGGQSLVGSGDITEVQNALTPSTILAPSVTAVITALALKSNISDVVLLTGVQTIGGTKTFSNPFLFGGASFESTVGESFSVKNKLVAGNWARGHNITDTAGVPYSEYGVYGTGQTFNYAYLGLGSNPSASAPIKYTSTGVGINLPLVTTPTVPLELNGSFLFRDGVGGIVGRYERGTGGILWTMLNNVDRLILSNKANTISYQAWFEDGNTTIGGTTNAGFKHDVQGSGRYTGQLTLQNFSAVLDFPSTPAQSSSDLTIAVTGAALGDCVILGTPNGSTLTNSSYSAWVSAAGTVTVRFNNYSTIAQNPASGTFNVKLIK